MIASELISNVVPVLKPEDTCLQALNWMELFRVSHLPMEQGKMYLGLVDDEMIYAHGDLNVPAEYVSPSGYNLGNWVKRQRYTRLNPDKGCGVLTPERIARLNAIGMQWDKPDPWQHRYKLAQKYKKAHGNLKIPAKYKTADGIWLSRWVYDQKRLLRDNSPKLSADQKQLLEELFDGAVMEKEPVAKAG